MAVVIAHLLAPLLLCTCSLQPCGCYLVFLSILHHICKRTSRPSLPALRGAMPGSLSRSPSTSTSPNGLDNPLSEEMATAPDRAQRYDRGIRVWGAHGQEALEAARVCLLNAGPTGTEALKNMVLGGIHSFTIVDGAKVEPADLGNNFLLTADGVSAPRAQCATGGFAEGGPRGRPVEQRFGFPQCRAGMHRRAGSAGLGLGTGDAPAARPARPAVVLVRKAPHLLAPAACNSALPALPPALRPCIQPCRVLEGAQRKRGWLIC